MKTFTKVVLIFSGIFITLGIVAVVIALTLGAKFYKDGYYKTTEVTHTYTDVTSLDMDVDVGEVKIKEGTEFKVEATGIVKDRFMSEVKDGIWTIKEKKNGHFIDFFFNIGDSIHIYNYSPEITVYIPKDFTLNKFDIDVGAGKTTVYKINTKDVVANVGAGELTINDLISEKSDIDCGVGSISISGKMTGYNKIDNGVGKIELNLVGKETDYNYKYSVGIGSVKINDTNYSNGTGDGKKDNNAANDFEIDCGVGSIILNIKE